MEYEISNRLSGVHGSMIRELFKLGASKDIISFGGGNPSAETFPCREIEEIAAKGLGENPVSLLQYGLSEGYTPLRDTMKKYLEKKEGFDFENNELFIVSGGQQCADLTTKALVNEGDVVLTEEPAFVFPKENHQRLHDTLLNSQGYVMVSYNYCPYICELYQEFYIFRVVRPNSMSQTAGSEYEEVIITNYDPRKAYWQLSLESLLNCGSEARYELIHEPERPIKTTN